MYVQKGAQCSVLIQFSKQRYCNVIDSHNKYLFASDTVYKHDSVSEMKKIYSELRLEINNKIIHVPRTKHKSSAAPEVRVS